MPPRRTLNLLGEICPMNWVRTKIALEELAPGESLEVWLDAGEPAESVPKSAAAEGYAIEAVPPGPGGGVALRILKPAP